MFGYKEIQMKKKLQTIAKRCPRCALPETFPGIKLPKGKACNYCGYYDLNKPREKEIKKTLKNKFVQEIKNAKAQNGEYDCIVAFSGGKDSTFLLHYLKKKFNLKILAHTFDNGFISKQTIKNIKHVTNILGVDHKFTKPPFKAMREVFKAMLTEDITYPKEILSMLSPVCAACLGMVFGTTIKLAMRLSMPLMFMGFTPGQYPAISLENFLKVNSCMFISDKIYRDDPVDIIKILRDPIDEKFGDKIGKYFLQSQYIKPGVKVPSILFPFHAMVDYSENQIFNDIKKLGWKKPEDTDNCSTNCLLNAAGIYSCKQRYGYHPYVGELSLLSREGKISYDDILSAEKIDKNSFALTNSLARLGISKSDLKI